MNDPLRPGGQQFESRVIVQWPCGHIFNIHKWSKIYESHKQSHLRGKWIDDEWIKIYMGHYKSHLKKMRFFKVIHKVIWKKEIYEGPSKSLSESIILIMTIELRFVMVIRKVVLAIEWLSHLLG
jgi:hypothetical protein